jgi:hypothetical protein
VEELRKTVQPLTASLGSLTEVFSLQGGEEVDGVRKVVMGGRGSNEPEMVESDSGLVLTPHGRWQVVLVDSEDNSRLSAGDDSRYDYQGNLISRRS